MPSYQNITTSEQNAIIQYEGISATDILAISFYGSIFIFTFACALSIRFQVCSSKFQYLFAKRKREKLIQSSLLIKPVLRHSRACLTAAESSVEILHKKNLVYPDDAAKSSCEKSKLVCPICLDEVRLGDLVVCSRSSSCRHIFHDQCLRPWLEGNDVCPCCRYSYLEGKPSTEKVADIKFCIIHGFQNCNISQKEENLINDYKADEEMGIHF